MMQRAAWRKNGRLARGKEATGRRFFEKLPRRLFHRAEMEKKTAVNKKMATRKKSP
jgi:hypothetical protein